MNTNKQRTMDFIRENAKWLSTTDALMTVDETVAFIMTLVDMAYVQGEKDENTRAFLQRNEQIAKEVYAI